MKTELLLKFVFEATHSLADYEEPHPHIWKLKVGISGDAIGGRILDIVKLRASAQSRVDRLVGTNLNENPIVYDSVREFPTCETLSVYFFREFQNMLNQEFLASNPSVKLSVVEVAICDMAQFELGAIRLTS